MPPIASTEPSAPGTLIGSPPAQPAPPSMPPLAVGGLVVTKAALVRALRAYVPQFVDLEPLEGGRYLLRLAEQE